MRKLKKTKKGFQKLIVFFREAGPVVAVAAVVTAFVFQNSRLGPPKMRNRIESECLPGDETGGKKETSKQAIPKRLRRMRQKRKRG